MTSLVNATPFLGYFSFFARIRHKVSSSLFYALFNFHSYSFCCNFMGCIFYDMRSKYLINKKGFKMSFTLSYINYNIQSPKKILFYKRIIHRVLYSIYFLRSKLNKFSDKSGIQFFGCMRNGRCIRQTT